VGMAPDMQELSNVKGRGSPAVMCPAFLCGRTWTAGLDGFRGSRPYQLVGI
jgi:pyruvate dehydrogenase complex dehydrogenase (E1) component